MLGQGKAKRGKVTGIKQQRRRHLKKINEGDYKI